MERRDRQARQLLPTHVLIWLSRLLHLCCSNVVAQAPNVLSPTRPERSWIVGHRGIVGGNQSVAPGCTDLCLNALSPIYGQTLVGISVQMYPCQDSDNSLFQYNSSTNVITMWDSTFLVNRCLDAGQFPPTNEFPFTLQECNASAAGQQWFFEVEGKVRSGLVNSSSALYMQGKNRQPQDWGGGWNTFGLYLSSEGNSDNLSSFSILHYVSSLSLSLAQLDRSPPPSTSTGVMVTDLLQNGEFEKCGYDPGPSGRADFGSKTWWFIICSWTITSGSVQLITPGVWDQARNGSNAALHLNGDTGPGAITQFSYSTGLGSNYSLSFDLAGDVTFSCGPSAKTLDVYVSPSSLPRTTLSFDVEGKSPRSMGWMSSPLLNFTAHGASINVTFQSTTSGSCGPVIDNVVVRSSDAATAADGKSKSRDSAVALRVLEVTVSVGAFVLLVLGMVCCYSYLVWRKGHSSTYFVSFKGIRCQSDIDSLNASSTSGSESLRGTHVTHYSWQELETATSNFTKAFGMGGSGVLLYLAEFPDGLLGAVKVDVQQREWPSDDAFRQEITTLQRAHHSYLVNLIGVSVGEGHRRALIFEYMPNGNLFDRLHRAQEKEPLAWQIRMVIAYQVACALEYLHEEASPPIVHRDVRSCNVLLQRDDSAKLTDFDLLKTSGRSSTSSSFETLNDHHHVAGGAKKGSFGYMDAMATYHKAPGRISKKTDVYSYGALLLELVTGLPPDQLESKLSAADFLLPVNGEEMVSLVDPALESKFNRHELNEITGIVVKCLKPDARLRPSMSDVVFMLKAGFASSRPLMGS